ncbi:MAG TPA: methyltransferase domain-containing protein [Ktedonobacterales bacterium]|nr:methyltransferase domain-containing protein [Ktedonobacterales bacterium]
MLPQIWHGKFTSAAEWHSSASEYAILRQVADTLDDRMLPSRRPFTFEAWCSACRSVQSMRVTWDYAGQADGAIWPAWTETAACARCGLNSRMRALFSFLDTLNVPADCPVYMSERVTAAYRVLEERLHNLTGSEYLGEAQAPGSEVLRDGIIVRHEDMTRLTFGSRTFGLVITMEVFEHIPDYKAAFREARRVLNDQGMMVFTIPFFPTQDDSSIRASVAEDGTIVHHFPPEYHGNPVGDGSSLCFTHFGWDILDDLRQAGFASASANLYWGPWQGHLGAPFFVFHASVAG